MRRRLLLPRRPRRADELPWLGNVFDSQPRLISNLIVDQTSENPAAVAAANRPVRSQDSLTPSAVPCQTDPVVDALGNVTTPGVPADCTPSHKTLFIPNVTTDVGLSPPYNSIFTFFGQFFDHGVDQTVKSGSIVAIPLRDGRPAARRSGPHPRQCGRPSAAAALHGPHAGPEPARHASPRATSRRRRTPTRRWSTRARPTRRTPSHQLFLREYNLVGGRPVDTGKLLGDPARAKLGPDGLPGTADDPRRRIPTATPACRRGGRSRTRPRLKLGILLKDTDVTNIPMMDIDPYGNYIPGPARGLPQIVTASGLVEGNITTPVEVPANARHFDTPFVTDIAHNADPTPTPPRTAPPAPDSETPTRIETDFTQQPRRHVRRRAARPALHRR